MGAHPSDKANHDQNLPLADVRARDMVDRTYPVRVDMLGHSAVTSRRDQPLCRKA